MLISPALKSSGNEWWARYQPQDLRVIDSPLGNKTDLQTLIKTLQDYGVEVYSDVVFNHMANESWKRSDLNYPGSEVLASYTNQAYYYQQQKLFGDLSHNLFSQNDFHPEGCITDWGNPVMFSIGGYAVAQVIAVYQTWMPTLGSSINSEPIYKRLSKWVSEDFELMRLST